MRATILLYYSCMVKCMHFTSVNVLFAALGKTDISMHLLLLPVVKCGCAEMRMLQWVNCGGILRRKSADVTGKMRRCVVADV